MISYPPSRDRDTTFSSFVSTSVNSRKSWSRHSNVEHGFVRRLGREGELLARHHLTFLDRPFETVRAPRRNVAVVAFSGSGVAVTHLRRPGPVFDPLDALSQAILEAVDGLTHRRRGHVRANDAPVEVERALHHFGPFPGRVRLHHTGLAGPGRDTRRGSGRA